jgi:UPF0755 protein
LRNGAANPIISVGSETLTEHGTGGYRMPRTAQTRERRRAWPVWPLALLVALLVISGSWILWALGGVTPEDGEEIRVRVVLPEGASASQIAASLQEKGLIRSSTVFHGLARLSGKDSSLKAGEYEFGQGESVAGILSAISSGRVVTVQVTIPEGLTAVEIARVFEERGLAEKEEMIALMDHPSEDLREDFPFLHEGASLEGYLFPDTYEFANGVSAARIVRSMLRRFQQTGQAALENHPSRPLHLKDREILILASIVEREAKLSRERPIIADVFLNRLERGIMLGSCATVQYVLPVQKERLLEKDLEVDSPYNTYKNAGLPPGPICNPGLASIEAVLNPEPGDYLYFVSAGDGSHVFSKTYTEHLQAKARINREAQSSR